MRYLMIFIYTFMSFTKIFRSPARVLNESVFKFGQLEVADNNFGVLQTIKVHQVLQLYEFKKKRKEKFITLESIPIDQLGLW